jgi:hypothetical protein
MVISNFKLSQHSKRHKGTKGRRVRYFDVRFDSMTESTIIVLELAQFSENFVNGFLAEDVLELILLERTSDSQHELTSSLESVCCS